MSQKQAGMFDTLSRAHAASGIRALYKQQPEDFVVTEELPFALSGKGEHVWLYIEKRGSNTDWVVRRLAEHAGVKLRQIGYAGLKDRQALCRQWFSVHLPGRDEPHWQALNDTEITVLEHRRHTRKLQRGALKYNHFDIRLRELAGDISSLHARCALIEHEGVPNYFGEQRFGRDMANLRRAQAMFQHPPKRLPRHQRSLYLSAARSWLFNRILSARIEQDCWNRRLPGDVFMLQGSSACFADDGSAALTARLQNAEIHPTAALWGDGESMARGDCAALEQRIAESGQVLADGLVAARLSPARRATRLLPCHWQWHYQSHEKVLRLRFSLPAGAYATAILRELGEIRQATAGKLPQTE